MINLISFLDEKNEGLQNIRCSFNLNSSYILDISLNIIKNDKLFKDINQMLHNRFNEDRRKSKLELKILNEYGEITNKLNLNCIYNGSEFDFSIIDNNKVNIKYQIL